MVEGETQGWSHQPVVGGRTRDQILSSQGRLINFMAGYESARGIYLVSVTEILASLSLGIISWYGNKTLLWTTSSIAVMCIQRL